jgi:hypothetical protein
MNDRRRAWECAFSLMGDFRDRLKPRAYGVCRAVLSKAPERLSPRRARRIQGIYASLVEPRT